MDTDPSLIESPLDSIIQKIIDTSPELIPSLESETDIPSLGLRSAARLPVVAAIYREIQAPILLIVDRSDHALTVSDELNLWEPDSLRMLFQEPTTLFYENAPWGITTRRDRLSVLSSMASYHVPGARPPQKPPIVIAPIRALLTRTIPRHEFLTARRVLKPPQNYKPDVLVRSWINLGYEPASIVITPGQFARRGGIIDIWPPPDPQPTRIEFFGDEIDTLRTFDPSSQRTLQTVDHLEVTPAREFIYREDRLPHDIQMSEISEFYIPYFHSHPSSLIDYLPSGALVLIENYDMIRDTVLDLEDQAVSMRQDYIEEGILDQDSPIPYISWTEIEDSLLTKNVVSLGPPHPEHTSELAQRFIPGPRFGGRLKTVMEHLKERQGAGDFLCMVSRQSVRLQALWSESTTNIESTSAAIHFIDGSLSEGWTFHPKDGPVIDLLTDGEIFGWRRPEPRKRHRPVAKAPEAVYADLEASDWVVHVDHGIGRFIDLVRRTVDNVEREYLCIEYAEGDQLFVPVYQSDRLTRYIGPDARLPSLSRLGSVEWRNVKSRVKEAVQEVAEDLLELFAKRSVVQGHAFAKDSAWQKELEASFPYIETEDQLRVIQEVKTDMERQRPMDRLICGDVGYGKTEVALRAAFKSVMDGKQVAMLVPTTVLAQQHYYTFRERLSSFPVEVEMLSRFRTHQQQQEILKRLKEGSLDIVIGTHRLIQRDVAFKDLGLLVIDEEQRFGVTHKETLKKMRTEVDVLTMTATPIPRTLYMTLTGVRDISTIDTPPEERLPIITHVGPYSQRLIRQAIIRELERGGQAFFVHNRVQTIEAMRSHLERLVPEARLTVAHGQMAESELSKRMQEFTAGQVDILLSTSIIESGLDIPNANTLIVDRADTFGLAQLYQLRGRVGRGAQRAYAYFFRHARRMPTLEGRQRLETIAENSQLGAGFSIAMHDLEIRGAGDILGTRQHGHIASVGFHLYTRLLADAVRSLKSDSDKPISVPDLPFAEATRLSVNVELPLPVSIPSSYIQDRDVRLRLYRRIADVRSLLEVAAIAEEFVDRFGPLPDDVTNLFFQVKVKVLAERSGISSISLENGQIVLRYPPLPSDVGSRYFPTLGPDVRTGKNSLWLLQLQDDGWSDRLLQVLVQLAENT
jgi:transcription-repair coupling factor (superfamily II helicase)